MTRLSERATRFAGLAALVLALGVAACAHAAPQPAQTVQAMSPSVDERTDLFKRFSVAFGAKDLPALYEVVTPDFLWTYHDGVSVTKTLNTADAITAHFADQQARYSSQRFYDVAFHHLPDRSFMTFRVSETLRADGGQRDQCGVEIYTFRDQRIATKDVYRKPCAPPK